MAGKKEKWLLQGVSRDKLTEAESEVVNAAITDPEATQSEIIERTGRSKQVVRRVNNEYLDEKFIPENLSYDDVTGGIYEVIIAGISAMEEVDRVERHYDLNLGKGDSKQVDVAYWHSVDDDKHLTTIECKFHKTSIEQDVVAAMAWYLETSEADRMFIVSSNGFQSGAKSLARDCGIELYTVEKLTSEKGEGYLTDFCIPLPQLCSTRSVWLHTRRINGGKIEVKRSGNSRGILLRRQDLRWSGRLLEKAVQDASLGKDSGIYYEPMKDTVILTEDGFRELTGIWYETTGFFDPSESVEFKSDEDRELILRNVLDPDESKLNLISIEEAVRAFEEQVR